MAERPRTPCKARFAVSVIGEKRGARGNIIHWLEVIDKIDADTAADANAYAGQKFETDFPDYRVINSLCEEIRHG